MQNPGSDPDIVVTAGQTTTVDVTLEKGGLISGRMTDLDGVGVAGAGVHVNDWGRATAADGSFTTIALLPGIYEMKVTPPEGGRPGADFYPRHRGYCGSDHYSECRSETAGRCHRRRQSRCL